VWSDHMPAQALYLKWRPQTLDEVVGQEHVTTTLRNALKQGKVRHAYLFSGPRGTGKTTIARLLAKAVNCLDADPTNRPCNVCAHCIAMNEGRFLDLIEIDAASHTSVDDVRDLRDKIAFSPNQGAYKVYIIDEVHRFSGAAFDALLKTLEEPPAHALFVLATTEIDKVPATIKSRCQRFDFRRIPTTQIVERLAEMAEAEGLTAERRALELVARQATGSLRDAISLLDQLMADPGERITRATTEAVLGISGNQAVGEVVQAVLDGSAAAGLEAINRAIDGGTDPRQMAREVVDWLRDVMLLRTGGPDLVDVSDTVLETITRQAAAADPGLLLRAVRAFNEAVNDARGGWQPQLPLELALIECIRQPAAPAPTATAAPAVPVIAQQQQPEPHPAQASAQSVPAPAPAPAPPRVAQTVVEPAASYSAPAPAAPGAVALTDIRARWNELIERVKQSDPTRRASGLLEHAQPAQVEGTTLILATSEVFKPRITKYVDHLLEALAAVFGVQLSVNVVAGEVNDAAGPETPNAAAGLPAGEQRLIEAAEQLGGEVRIEPKLIED
jgi:DNA polymerase-3 subunit gamma/tau